MATCHPVRSQSTTRTCRDCEGAGQLTYPSPYGSSPFDREEQCTACDGTGRIVFRDLDVLERLRYVRTYGSRFQHYPTLRASAYAPVALPGAAA